jgi:hypothetical protein
VLNSIQGSFHLSIFINCTHIPHLLAKPSLGEIIASACSEGVREKEAVGGWEIQAGARGELFKVRS